jgi:hypothetical protein
MKQLVRLTEGAVMQKQQMVPRKRMSGWARAALIVAGTLATLYVGAALVVLYALSAGDWG